MAKTLTVGFSIFLISLIDASVTGLSDILVSFIDVSATCFSIFLISVAGALEALSIFFSVLKAVETSVTGASFWISFFS